jgi:predicted nucleic acid-binding protein
MKKHGATPTAPSVAYDDGVFIADKSAWECARNPAVRAEWSEAMLNGQICTCPIVNLELLYSTQDEAAFGHLEADLAQLRDIPITRSVTNAALAGLRQLASLQPLYHRVKLPDALIAAAAQDAGVGVLHYDHHYDRLAEVLVFESRWIAPAGSV